MKKIFIVTGATGHLGSTIVRTLCELKLGEVRCLVLPNDDAAALKGLDCKIFFGDVTDKDSLRDIFSAQENDTIFVIHCAAVVYIGSARNKKVREVNVNGVKNVVDAAFERKVEKFVHVSSVHAIPEGKKGSVIREIDSFSPKAVKGLYAKTKAEASQYVLDKAAEGLNACILHPSGIIGPNDYCRGHLTQMVIDFLDGRLVAGVKGGYDFVDVRDVAAAAVSALEKGEKGECYLLTGRFASVKETFDILSETSGKRKVKTFLPRFLCKMFAPFAELYYKILKQPPLFTSYSLYTLGVNSNFDNSKAKEKLGFAPRPLQETLEDTVRWLSAHGRLGTRRKTKCKVKATGRS